jgi:hypothetical protein
MEDEPICQAEQEFAAAAAEYGLIPKGETIPLPLWQYTMAIVELCASIGDKYSNDEGNAGEEIRAVLGEP